MIKIDLSFKEIAVPTGIIDSRLNENPIHRVVGAVGVAYDQVFSGVSEWSNNEINESLIHYMDESPSQKT